METLPERLHIADTDWTYVKTRALESGYIYLSTDGSSYLRAGPRDRIQDELIFAELVYKQGFPTPEILSNGEISSDTAYFTESSLGSKTFGDLFKAEFSESKSVKDATFNQYCHIAVLFLLAQLKSAVTINEPSNLREGIGLANVVEENPDLDQGQLETVFRKAEAKISGLPLVLTHGDLGPFNMMPGGVIDFEHKFIAPAGFDVLTSPFIGRFWNFTTPDGDNKLAYDFSETQIRSYFNAVDSAATHLEIEKLSQYTDDMLMLKAIWGVSFEKGIAEKIGHDYVWQIKKATLRYCINQYLAGQPIDSNTFGKHLA